MTKLYHKDICIIEKHKNPCWKGLLKYTRHALNAARNDRYGYIELPNQIDYEHATLIEVEVDVDDVINQVWRVNYDDSKDLVIVITNEGRVKTVWFNSTSDSHKTLNVSKYELVKDI